MISGETAEAMFIVECQKRGINCSKPFSGNSVFDFVTYFDGALYKIQVKSSMYSKAGLGRKNKNSSQGTRRPYSSKDIDFFALLDAVTGVWNIVPYSIRQSSFRLKQKTKYTEAWEQLKK